MKCPTGKEVAVLYCAAGYYVGAFDDEGPYCQISGYFNSKEDAQTALDSRSFYRDAPENYFCCGVGFCLPEKEAYDDSMDSVDFDDLKAEVDIADPEYGLR